MPFTELLARAPCSERGSFTIAVGHMAFIATLDRIRPTCCFPVSRLWDSINCLFLSWCRGEIRKEFSVYLPPPWASPSPSSPAVNYLSSMSNAVQREAGGGTVAVCASSETVHVDLNTPLPTSPLQLIHFSFLTQASCCMFRLICCLFMLNPFIHVFVRLWLVLICRYYLLLGHGVKSCVYIKPFSSCFHIS